MNTQNFVFEEIKDCSSIYIEDIKKAYEYSFPENERRDFELLKKLMHKDSLFKSVAFHESGKFLGFLNFWDFNKFIYIEHFAISSNIRGKGIGSWSIEELKKLTQKPIVLEVELPNEEMAKRRIAFYERLGFKLDNHQYYQPPYRKGEDFFEMLLMTYKLNNLDDKTFEEIKNTLYKNVYNFQEA